MGALLVSCGEVAPPLTRADERDSEQALERLQQRSPLRPSARSFAQVSVAVPPVVATPVGLPPAPEASAELAADELMLADAGVPEPLEPSGSAASDAGASEGEALPPSVGDAGPPVVVEPSVAPPPVELPAALPTDIVAQSALPLHALVDGQLLREDELWELLARKPVTCFGELHDRPQDHYAETRALAELVARAQGTPLALGMEMFQKPYQAPLSAYVQGQLDEAGLIAGTEYETRWGWDFSFYRPLLETARSERLPTLALNAPRELTRKIGRTGLESLDESERAQLPELNLDDAEHREFIFTLLGALDHELQLQLENVYVAQTTWDETMAQTSATWLAGAGPDARLLILAGAAHCHQSAIPRRLTRRSGLEVTSLAVALASELSTPGFSAAGYDVLVVLEDVALPPTE
jgi:uncharacterized iron-regulated protein